MEEEGVNNEHRRFEKLKGNKGKIIMRWMAYFTGSQLRNLETEARLPLLSVFAFLAANVSSKDEILLGSVIEYVVSRCGNTDLNWIVGEL